MPRLRFALVAAALFAAACGGSGVELSEVGAGSADPTAPAGPEGGRTFTDPQNEYQIVIDPAWVYDTTAGGGLAEIWFVTPVEIGQFGSNVNVLTQEIGNMSLDTYIEASLLTLDDFIDDPEVQDSGTVDAADGDRLGRLVYTGAVDGKRLKFLQYVDVDDGVAVIATLTATPNDYAALATTIEPYLATVSAR